MSASRHIKIKTFNIISPLRGEGIFRQIKFGMDDDDYPYLIGEVRSDSEKDSFILKAIAENSETAWVKKLENEPMKYTMTNPASIADLLAAQHYHLSDEDRIKCSNFIKKIAPDRPNALSSGSSTPVPGESKSLPPAKPTPFSTMKACWEEAKALYKSTYFKFTSRTENIKTIDALVAEFEDSKPTYGNMDKARILFGCILNEAGKAQQDHETNQSKWYGWFSRSNKPNSAFADIINGFFTRQAIDILYGKSRHIHLGPDDDLEKYKRPCRDLYDKHCKHYAEAVAAIKKP